MLFSRTHPSTFPFSGTIAHAGVFEIAVGARVPKSQTHAYAQTVRHESQMNETAEGCAPRWSRVFSRHHRSSLEIPSPRPFFPSFPRSSSLPPSRSFLPSLLAFPHAREFLRWPKFKVSARRHLIPVPVKTAPDARRTIKRHDENKTKNQASARIPSLFPSQY